ncbi:carboxypeptidase regulatory-like domain-containing protein [Aeromicrobium massiliense]|uniref:carboxypeptidase regulatory-like domain-containing protein n=1 Tax=Aeromicrobium massiliense TaxID=1464554 RepID=UPI000315AAF5|nr:carboxypeptidase regulatory-like domain-containing protein [Aeromicrobium massiliense]
MAPARPSLVRLVLSLVLALGGLVAVSGTAVADDPQVPSPLSLVTGTVTLSDGAAAAAVTVSAAPKAGTEGTTASTSTDATGAYALELGTGTYTITYALDRYDTRKVEDVIVTAARTLDPVELARLYRLSGTVTFKDGTPATGARVQAWTEDEDTELESRTTVGSDGRFQLDLPRGEYDVYVAGRGVPAREYYLVMDRDRTITYSATRTPSVTGTVQLDDGQSFDQVEGSVDVQQRIDGYWDTVDWADVESDGSFETTLAAGTYRFQYWADGYASRTVDVVVTSTDRTVDPVVLARLPRVTGSATLSDGASFADVDGMVVVDRRLAGGAWDEEHDLRGIRADGSFTLPLAPGTYRVSVQAYGYSTVVVQDVVVTSADQTLAPLTLTRLPRLTGTVSLSDGGSHADAETTVALMEQQADGSWDHLDYAWVEADGSFVLPAPEGTFRLEYDAYGYSQKLVDVTVTGDRVLEPVVLTPLPVVSGTVSLAGGVSPVSVDAYVVAVQRDEIVAGAQVEANGSFAFAVPDGDYTLAYYADGFDTVERALTVSGDTVVPLVTLAKLARVTGRVVLAAGTNPVSAGARVVALRKQADGTYVRETGAWVGASGTYTLLLGAGTYRLQVSADGHATATLADVVVTGDRVLEPVALTRPDAPLENLVAPTIPTQVVAGQRLTPTPGTWSRDGITLSYQWLLDGQPLKGVTSRTITVPGSWVERRLSVGVKATAPGQSAAWAISDEVLVDMGQLVAATPVVVGSPRVGQALRVGGGAVSPAAEWLSYTWRVDGRIQYGKNKSTFVPEAKHLGRRVTVEVYGTRTGFRYAKAISKPSAAVGIGTIGVRTQPSVTGKARVGSTLTVRSGSYTPGKVRLRYQWFVAGRRVSGATTSSFRPTSAHRGRKVSVRVTVSATGYTTRSITTAAKRVAR